MNEETLSSGLANPGQSTFIVEHTFSIGTGQTRASIALSQCPKMKNLKSLFAKVELTALEVEVRQDSLAGDGESELALKGHVYVAIIPTLMDTDVLSGSSKAVIDGIPFKQTFPLAVTHQSNVVFRPSLRGYELDLAQDPRRNAGPVAWMGNSGVKPGGKVHMNICTATWRMTLSCSGESPLWM